MVTDDPHNSSKKILLWDTEVLSPSVTISVGIIAIVGGPTIALEVRILSIRQDADRIDTTW